MGTPERRGPIPERATRGRPGGGPPGPSLGQCHPPTVLRQGEDRPGPIPPQHQQGADGDRIGAGHKEHHGPHHPAHKPHHIRRGARGLAGASPPPADAPSAAAAEARASLPARGRFEPSFSDAHLTGRLPHVLTVRTDMDGDQVRRWVAMRAERSGLADCTYLGAVGDDMIVR